MFSFNKKDGIGSSGEHLTLYADVICFNSAAVAGSNSYNYEMLLADVTLGLCTAD